MLVRGGKGGWRRRGGKLAEGKGGVEGRGGKRMGREGKGREGKRAGDGGGDGDGDGDRRETKLTRGW